MQKMPRCAVIADPTWSLEWECADSWRMRGHEVGRPKPLLPRNVRARQERARDRRRLTPAGTAFENVARRVQPRGCSGALWADESIRPSTSNQVCSASRVRGNLLAELTHVLRISWATPCGNMLNCLTGVKGISIWFNSGGVSPFRHFMGWDRAQHSHLCPTWSCAVLCIPLE